MSTASDADQARSQLYDIMKQDASFEEKAQQALKLGEAYLDVENGHVTRIDSDTDYWETIVSTDPPDGTYPTGLVLDLSTTYCRRTIASDSPVALHDAPDQGWADDPAYKEHGLHCYHGTTLTVDGEPYGTVCFVSEEPREGPFSDGDTMFAELIARMLEHELEYNRQKAELTQRENTITVLSRVLRHNLRNDMSVIRGHVTRLADQLDDSDGSVELIVSLIDELLDLSDTARTLESTISTTFDRQPTDLTAIIDESTTRVKSQYPSASVAVEGTENATVATMPSLHTALEELLENAAKHAQNPQVTVSVEVEGSNAQIQVTDNGPGLPEQERKVLQEGTEMPLVHGSGLGLWLVHEIVTAHGGSINVDVSEAGTRMTITLPRSTEATETQPLERRLQREHDRFEAVFEGAFDGMVILDDDAQIVEANSAAGDLCGVASQDLLGHSLWEFLPPEFDFESAWESLLSDGRDHETVRIVRADGRERIIEYVATADVLPGQHLTVMRDVTDREEHKQEIERTSQRLAAVFEACPDPLVVVDTDGRIERWNSAAEDTFGWRKEEVLGDPPPIVPADEGERRAFEDRMRRVQEGEQFRGLEVQRETKDGEMIDVSISTAPIRDAGGDVAGTVAIIEDISERMARERELAETSQQLEGVLDTAPAAVFMKDTDGKYLLMNRHAREIAGLDQETSVTGKTDHDLFPDEVAKQFRADDEYVRNTGETIKYAEEVPTPDGPKRHLTIKRPVFDETGDLYGICAVSMEVSEFENIHQEDSGKRKYQSERV